MKFENYIDEKRAPEVQQAAALMDIVRKKIVKGAVYHDVSGDIEKAIRLLKKIEATKKLDEAKLNFPKDVELFVSKQKTWFQIDNSTPKYLDYNTRRHGNVGEETPGREDVREANRLRQLLLKKFGKAIKVQVDAVDEFTELYITKK